MKRIVWMFGDGSAQFTQVNPLFRLEDETEDQQIERIIKKVGPALRVSPVRIDLTKMNGSEHADYIATLGAGSIAQFIGIISEDEYQEKYNSLRDFREAWTLATHGPVIDTDMPKARDIHMSRIRSERNSELERLDIESIKAQDKGDDALLSQIRTRKQELRDLPKTIKEHLDNAKNTEDLKLITII